MSLDKTWEEKAEEWATFARSPAHDHFFWEFNGPRFLDLVPPPGRLTVDVGCGEGRLGRLLCERGHSVIAIDGSPAMARMAHRGGSQRVLVADAAYLPLKSGIADIAVAFMSLQDVPDLDRTIAEVARVLVPAGRFCLAIAHPLRSAGGFASKDRGSPFTLPSYFDQRAWRWSSQHTGMHVVFPGIHRPLENYTQALEAAGFLIETLREPRPADGHVARYPESARWQRIPCFLHIRAMRP
jgi:SAM-dependent methyltransferase